MIATEEAEWQERHGGSSASETDADSKSFEEYREKSKAAGVM